MIKKIKMICHRQYEAALLNIVAKALLSRNVARSPVISRKDNNAIFEMSFKLEAIAKRVKQGYGGKIVMSNDYYAKFALQIISECSNCQEGDLVLLKHDAADLVAEALQFWASYSACDAEIELDEVNP